MNCLFGLRSSWVFFLLLLFVSVAQAQNSGKISLNKKSHDFGEIGIGHDRLADFVITNTGSEEVFFLRKECDEDVVVKFSANSIKPGESATIRLKYNPMRKGQFTRKVDIYTSAENEAFVLTLKGNVKAIEENMDLACPNFNETPQEKAVENVFTVEVIDKQTGNPIQGADVHFRPNPAILPYMLTDKNGLVKQKTPIGLYDIWANAKGYRPDSTYMYIGKNTSTTVLYLDRLPDNPVPVFAEKDENEPERETENEVYKEKRGELSAVEYASFSLLICM